MAASSPTKAYRWTVLGIIMMGTFMAILDSSIVNVALPHMMSALSVNRDQIEWVSTAFMIATAVTMPLVGWLVNRFGHKSLYLTSLALFTLGSAACAFAWSYNSLITARIIQAIGGGAIQPVGMAIVAELFEPQERGRALGIWGTGIMVGPAIGPTLGGYLTDTFNWRTIFSVNIPFGIITLLAGLAIMGSELSQRKKLVPFDTWGFAFLTVALIGSLLALSNGQEKGWDSNYVYTCLAFAVVGVVMFLAVESTVDNPLLPLWLFRSRNFSISMVLALFRAVGLFGGLFLLPIFLESLVGYTTIQAGLWMMPGATTVGIMMPISGRLADRYNPWWLVAMGTAATGISLIMYGNLDPLSGAMMIIGPQVLRGAGLAFMMAPLITTAINSVPGNQVATASSFLNVAQRVGGAFGIALLNTYVTNSIHTHAVRMGTLIPTQSEEFRRLVGQISGITLYHLKGIMLTDQTKGLAMAVRAIMQKASVMGFDNGFVLGGIIVLVGVPLAMMLEPNIKSPQ